MFERVLIANRGEVAVRIAGTLRRLGVESVAVFAPEDHDAPHVRACDHGVALDADGERSPYLDLTQLVRIAGESACDAVHPGYGFLAERADAAQAFVDAGVVWIGPSPEAIELLGDKIASKRTAEAADVPVVPGLQGTDVDAGQVEGFAAQVGLPLLLKASAGGGGKGMRRVDDAADIPAAVDAARREAQAAFGRSELLVERLVEPARHVEVQVAVDAHGGAWAIGERECSLQRRHQKLIEESPAVCLSDAERDALHVAAVRLAVAAGYRNLGTVEFLLDARPATATNEDGSSAPRPFFFLEMNARLQVEHPVTELVHDLDLVELQLRIADGEALGKGATAGSSRVHRLDLDAAAATVHGHAIEARICAERVSMPATDGGSAAALFLPATGTIVAYEEPTGPGVRVDSGITVGTVVSTAFDPLLLKVIVHGRDRTQALGRLDRALAELTVLGVQTNAGFLRRLLRRPEVQADAQTTTTVQRLLADPEVVPSLCASPVQERDRGLRAAVAWRRRERSAAAGPGAFSTVDSWRSGASGWTHLRLEDPEGQTAEVVARMHQGRLEVGPITVPEPPEAILSGWTAARDGDWLWLHGPDGTWAWRDAPETASAATQAAGSLAAPLPGVVIAVRAAVGDTVAVGQPVVVLESMKMELDVSSPHAGTVGAVHVAVGDRVARGQILAAVEEDEGSA